MELDTGNKEYVVMPDQWNPTGWEVYDATDPKEKKEAFDRYDQLIKERDAREAQESPIDVQKHQSDIEEWFNKTGKLVR